MKHLTFNIVKGFIFLIFFCITLFSGLYVFTEEHKPGIDDTILTYSFYISIPLTIISFIIMWKSRYYYED